MSEHLTHIAVYEDTTRILLHTDRFCKAFRQCLTEHYDTGLMTSGSRGNHIFAVPILQEHKDRWPGIDREAKMQIAGSLGWILHRAADLEMKPTWGAKARETPGFPQSEMQVYHDAVVVQKVYDGGRMSTLSPNELITRHTLENRMASHPASGYVATEQAETLITLLYQQQFVEMHRFHQEEKDVDLWMDNFLEYHQEFSEDLRMYIDAFTNPEPGKMDEYVYGINFYDEQDLLIRWVRGIQHGEDVSGINLDEALALAADQSHYARALLRGYTFLYDASEYFENRKSKQSLYDTLAMPEDQRP